MNEIIDWITKNKEWVFSGIGATVIGAIIGFMKMRSGRKNEVSQRSETNIAHNKSAIVKGKAGDINIK
ncbi:MAG: hypothetical protein GY749_22265 [Desulfobacteraceae bacterium]|nr:hypothetical protein [Desulfobacteraceae bacterium]